MKERLVELVDKAKKEYVNDVTDHTETEYIVEGLLNEGVIVPSEDYAKIVRCSECEYLKVIGTKEIYARCEKYGFEFLPFKADTRNHFCIHYK